MAPSVNIHVAAQRLREQALALELAAASEKGNEIVAGVAGVTATLGRIINNLDPTIMPMAYRHLAAAMTVTIDAKIVELEKAVAAKQEADEGEKPAKKK